MEKFNKITIFICGVLIAAVSMALAVGGVIPSFVSLLR
jgi:hypothetical protein